MSGDRMKAKLNKFICLSYKDKIFYILSGTVLTIFFLLVLYPCIFVLSASLSSGSAVQSGKVFLLPVEFNISGYEAVFKNSSIWLGFFNSMFYTVFGTAINIFITLIAAYALSRNDLIGRNWIMLFFTFTMFFNGGIITNYLLMGNLGLLNTRWALLLPGALSVYNMIVAKTFIQNNVPQELLEASQIDGCSDIRYFLSVVLPLSKAVIAVLVLFYGVAHWNTYFNAMIYLNDRDLFPLTIFLKEILIAGDIDPSTVQDPVLQEKISQLAGVIKYALIVVSMIPVLIIYPFIQKYFVKGVTIGAVKG
ncbi:carbohydrate ABC transporter permease [Konateibacter massiliensis]|uniref:carbohydrate ABC transporter permease n=1 Tax=Konateibacter massiliensis TaxID=2002841 RepID=UPI001F1A636A|nr:carbohydrate ABC transporter permease [Konateibacter massiliensis]